MGETGVTVTGEECCVGWYSGLEVLPIPRVRLSLSGKIMGGVDKVGVWMRRHGGRKKDER